ncbi:lmbr1 long form [Heterostelium album PN500]|uniref:Lmbr1 long form n=1 Tax=Heterostelium pallidum (strain ATCC 26659 / Pp 5 / PN500) TaxID=670386 RepID=D3B9Q3_HETP5|nr:lmbr1 long form [Heterostelium album PN500]EFA81965.1 lmbr1 long form [Heterostelium album PN500]|eukprot:XP_020434082.1 lmbr1 long form [Heterostelium album PN500]
MQQIIINEKFCVDEKLFLVVGWMEWIVCNNNWVFFVSANIIGIELTTFNTIPTMVDKSNDAKQQLSNLTDNNNSNNNNNNNDQVEFIFSFMRDGIVSFTFLLTLFILSHFIVRKYIRKKDVDKILYLPRILCTFCLSVSLAAMLLIPITIISNEIITTFPSNYYIQWLHRDLIFSFWNKIFWGSNISLFIILPFAYFYYEAEGLKERSFISRIKAALLVFLLVSLIFIGMFVDRDNIQLLYELNGKVKSKDYLPFSYSLISTMGTLLVLFCIPKGFNTLTSNGINFGIQQSKDEIEAVQLEVSTLRESLENGKLNENERKRTEVKLLELNQIIKKFGMGTKRPFLRKLLSFIITLINFAFTGWVVFNVFIHSVKKLFNNTSTWTTDFLAYSSKLGPFESLLETAVVIIPPKVQATSMRKLIMNTAIILLMSSSFPVVVRILEISRFDLMGSYTHTNYLRDQLFQFLYCTTFIGLLVHSYLQFLLPKSESQSPLAYILSSLPYYKNKQQQKQQLLLQQQQRDANLTTIASAGASSSSLPGSSNSTPTLEGSSGSDIDSPPYTSLYGHYHLNTSSNSLDTTTNNNNNNSNNNISNNSDTLSFTTTSSSSANSSPIQMAQSSHILSLILSSTASPNKKSPTPKRKLD